MDKTANLLRAITGVFARRLIRRVLFVYCGFVVVTTVGLALLATKVDPAWLLAWILLGPVLAGMGLCLGLVWLAAGRMLPRKLSRAEAKSVHDFTDRALAAADRVKTPLPILFFGLVKSLLLHRDTRFISELLDESKLLKAEFLRLRDSFS
ncbi:MAG: hypothetical protein QG629_824 [Patescibacteria group bacterium]|nr:hypothetical protein [Patescibacteria group bacterium]